MANTSSAKKAVRSQARKTDVNRNRRTMVKSNLRNVEDAITKGDKAAATAALKAAEPAMMLSLSVLKPSASLTDIFEKQAAPSGLFLWEYKENLSSIMCSKTRNISTHFLLRRIL